LRSAGLKNKGLIKLLYLISELINIFSTIKYKGCNKSRNHNLWFYSWKCTQKLMTTFAACDTLQKLSHATFDCQCWLNNISL
jgi:hypothetical protein